MIAPEAVIEALRKRFAGDMLDVCVLGSRSAKDFDVVVTGREGTPEDVTRSFLCGLRDLLGDVRPSVIARPEHRLSFPAGVPILHFIFYTSYAHLAVCEVPSFLASVYDSGNFIHGSREALAEAARAYRARSSLSFSMTDLQAARYAELATMSLIYLTTGVKPFPETLLKELATYVLRFTLIERIADIDPDFSPALWSWDGLIRAVQDSFPEQRTVLSWFEHRDDHRWLPADADLIRAFYAVLRLLGPRAQESLDRDLFDQSSSSAER